LWSYLTINVNVCILMIRKEYILTNHAKKRLLERNISFSDLEAAIEDPDVFYKGRLGEINALKKIQTNKNIRVVYRIQENVLVIITAMWK
jgi:hypothetical protein